MSLSGRICVVTGATRGIGKGIALQLGEAGATVYITGRTMKAREGIPGSLEETAQEIEERGGKCIPVQCDHTQDDQIKNLFDKVREEQNGRLDLLVNNAYSAVNTLIDNWQKKFWETSPELWDEVNNVGLRNHYICSVYAARMMVERGEGLIVFLSSPGGMRYLFNVPYGVGKEAADRMAVDCAFELRKKNVASVSLWPALVQTELLQKATVEKQYSGGLFKMFQNSVKTAESTEFSGKAVVALMKDKNIMSKSGRILMTGDLADEYGFSDIDGTQPYSTRCIKGVFSVLGYHKLSWIIPRWLKFPKWALVLYGSKF